MGVKLKYPVCLEFDENEFVDITDFRGYARYMMYPEPVGIVLSDELNDMATRAVNERRVTIDEAFSKLVKRDSHGHIDYGYSDGLDGFTYGQELLFFCDENTAEQLLFKTA